MNHQRVVKRELTFNMGKGTEGPSGAAATLLHVITFS